MAGNMGHIHKDPLEPAQFLVDNIDILPAGRALDVAMGNGRNAIYLARMGFEVEVVDASAERVSEAINTSKRLGVDIKTSVADLEDNYSMENSVYDVIICFNYLHRPLIPRIKSGVRSGGMVVYETFIIDHAVLFGKPRNQDFLLKHNKMLDLFRDFRCLRYREGIIEDRGVIANVIAEKVE